MRPLLINSAPLRDSGGHIVGGVAVFQDITALKELERQKDDFLAAASHDLKNPLANIKGRAQLLKRRAARLSDPEASRLVEGLGQIDLSASRATTMINELLDLTRLQMGRSLDLDPQPMDLVSLATRVVSEYQQTTDRHVIEVQLEAPTLTGVWDAQRSGAGAGQSVLERHQIQPGWGDHHRHAEPRDRPTWSLGSGSSAGPWDRYPGAGRGVNLPALPPREQRSGPNQRDRARTRRCSADRRTARGDNLGRERARYRLDLRRATPVISRRGSDVMTPTVALCLDRSVCRRNTREGTDGRARCQWRTREIGENAADMSAMSGDAPRSNGPVLVVDDDPGLREIIRETLEDEGLLVDVARDGPEALEIAAQRRPDLVVLDWGLPVFDGDVVAARPRDRHTETPSDS